ncbi:DUF3221 domain-containing protein [Psychrobacillus sp. L4]|uniref:DUF3221 domain-containing protein n=1 Tax=Psychrobacillus sp. L4 TaxID=3236892 RepID=UPI0036F32840
MKKHLILLLILCFTLVGCNQKEDAVKGGIDKKGIITKIDSKGNRILVDDVDTGLIWIAMPDNGEIKNYEEGQEVVIWIDGGIDESYPAKAKALNIEHSNGNQSQSSLPKFIFKNEKFPPSINCFVKINDIRYEMTKGNSKWKNENESVQTDAASPTQIAESFKVIAVEPNNKITIEIEQNPNLSVYLWDSEEDEVTFEKKQITVPTNQGRYIYEVVAKWSNGEISYTFVVEVK